MKSPNKKPPAILIIMASLWLSVLSDLQNRGVEDILIACVDGLTIYFEGRLNTVMTL
ncbi:hypothetical protein OM280_18510 [Escherichia albertii]|nr:hypothetical protein [Escherichia albertii]